jgi:hypothetical protein
MCGEEDHPATALAWLTSEAKLDLLPTRGRRVFSLPADLLIYLGVLAALGHGHGDGGAGHH